jgi:uncharacterized membrane protein SirB2
MENTRKLWLGLAALLVASFSVLLWLGSEIYREKPPEPAAFVGPDGAVLYTREDYQTGREVWQSIGGMQLGSIWGHGAYVAPDWSADWLHRESVAMLDGWARAEGAADFAALARHVALRITSWTIDSFLLTFALMLWTTLKLNPVLHPWLGVKLLLLVVYVGLGARALRLESAFGPRLWWTLAALATVATMYGIARAHHPLGWLRWWGLL